MSKCPKDTEIKATVQTVQVYSEEKLDVFVKIDIKGMKKGLYFFFFSLGSHYYVLFIMPIIVGYLD